MAVKKQPESNPGKLHEAVNDWFRQFLKHLELYIVETGQSLTSNSNTMDFSRAAIQAVKLTLLDSGADNEQVQNLFGRVALGEDFLFPERREWNAELNKRRFELIDMDIQRTLSHAEQLELGVLTQLMRDYVDSDINLPIAGAKVLHRLLSEFDKESTDSE
jgi:hypothetical protein